jgi:hypothetical protein
MVLSGVEFVKRGQKGTRAYAFWLHVHAVALKRSATPYEGRHRVPSGCGYPAASSSPPGTLWVPGLALLAGGFSLPA